MANVNIHSRSVPHTARNKRIYDEAGGNTTVVNTVSSAPSFNQVQSDWREDDPSDPSFIKNKPDIPDPQVQSNWEQADDTQVDYIKNKPILPEEYYEGWDFIAQTASGDVEVTIYNGDKVYFKAGNGIELRRSTDINKGNVIEINVANLIDDLNFDYRDIEGKAMTYVLILKAAFKFNIVSLCAVCDAATSINGVSVKINNVAVTGISAVTVTTTPQEFTATADNLVNVGDTVTLTATGITGSPTELVASLFRRRVL